MPHRLAFCLVIVAAFAVSPPTPAADSAPAAGEKIDFDKARGLLRKQKEGTKLTDEEQAYLKKAQAARNAGQPDGQRRPTLTPSESKGFIPLTEMTAENRYRDQDGGLYGSGKNEPTEPHRLAAEKELSKIQPLNAEGKPDPRGTIAFVSISMSNATQEFSVFKRIADADPQKSKKLTIVDCAQGGKAMAQWVSPDAEPWKVAAERLERANVSPAQVQVAWVKLANVQPTGSLEEHGKKLQRDTLAVLQNARTKFPNLRITYLSSRIYAGYATGPLNPEPYAYESAFVVRWLIQDQVAGNPELNFDPDRGAVKTPLLLWGPYLWADGTTPRKSDGLIYTRSDLGPDGTHPSDSGRVKVANQILQFVKNDKLARSWFVEGAR
jgi:hypothetical protein